jgi:hypothetical protein
MAPDPRRAMTTVERAIVLVTVISSLLYEQAQH